MTGIMTEPGGSAHETVSLIPALRRATQGGSFAGGKQKGAGTTRADFVAGYSLLELMISVAIILLLMSAIFPFISQSQKAFQGNQTTAEAAQSARSGLEVIAQEIGQAGYNPNFGLNTPRNSSSAVTAAATPQCITVNSIAKINPGDWLYVDTGPNEELVEVLSTSATPSSPCTPASSNKIYAVFSYNHCPSGIASATECATSPNPYPIISYKMPYGVGIVAGSGDSNDNRLEFFGDINQDGTINYVVYSINPVTPATTVTINGVVYTVYNLYRSITPVTFANLPGPGYAPTAPAKSVNNPASVLVPNILYNTTTSTGPTGQPIFGYPNTVTIGVVPNVITVVDTIVITLSVDVSPLNLATGQHQWTTMATQIRPINLNASLAVNTAGGVYYLPLLPKTLPMTDPTKYYQ